MRRGDRYGGFWQGLRDNLAAILLFAVLAGVLLWGLSDAETVGKTQGLRAAEESLHRAIVTCYAIEGRYPQSYEYLTEHYPVRIDESRYTVIYSIFAENIMPDVTVIEKAGEDG